MEKIILCVDDEKLVLESLVSQLRSHYGDKFVYETAENPELAWEIIHEAEETGDKIWVVISDWLMPIQKGDQFLMEVNKHLPDSKLIMLSGHAEQDAIQRARTYANLYRFIRKPWEKQEITKAIDEITALRQANR